jgi:hypothetical protein
VIWPSLISGRKKGLHFKVGQLVNFEIHRGICVKDEILQEKLDTELSQT